MDELAVLWFVATMAIGALLQLARASNAGGDALAVVTEATFLEAVRRKHRVATTDHLFAVLLEVPEVAAVWQTRGWPLKDVRRTIADRLASLEGTASYEYEPLRASSDLARVLRVAEIAGGPQSGPPRDALVLATLVRGAMAREAAEGTTLGAAFERLPHQAFSIDPPAIRPEAPSEAPYRSMAPPSPAAKVVFWNDNRTTMEAVVKVLVDAFGMSETRAFYLMLSVHRRGRAVVWSAARLEAEGLAARATNLARSMGMPLRVSVEV